MLFPIQLDTLSTSARTTENQHHIEQLIWSNFVWWDNVSTSCTSHWCEENLVPHVGSPIVVPCLTIYTSLTQIDNTLYNCVYVCVHKETSDSFLQMDATSVLIQQQNSSRCKIWHIYLTCRSIILHCHGNLHLPFSQHCSVHTLMSTRAQTLYIELIIVSIVSSRDY